MRRPVLALSVLAAVATAGAALAVPPTVPSTPATAPFASSNVTHVGTIPLEGVGVSMEVRQVGDQVRAFVSGAGGLSIYDATDPTAPELLGHLPIYNWENEDIAVSEDGSTAVLTEFQGLLYLHVVDVSNPVVPVITGSIVRGGAHTVVCADEPCDHLYGSEGQTYDITDRTAPRTVPTAQSWGGQLGVRDGHNLHQDEAGYWISDTNPLRMFEQVDGDPLRVREITRGRVRGTGYQHNNIRPNADQYVPRQPGEDSPTLRPGELLLGNGETNFTGTCDGGSGAFSTWSMRGWDQGQEMRQLDVLRPVSGDIAQGDPAYNAMGCSGHWFTERDAEDDSILVAAAWYEHGTRFIKVDPATGDIRQVGFFQPVRGAASEAYLMPDADPTDGKHVVWTVDFHSGLDILLFDERAEEPTVAEVDASWLAKKGVQDVFSIVSRELCRAGADATQEQHDRMHAVTTAVGKDTRALSRLLRLG